MNKLSKYEIHQVLLDFTTITSWLKMRTKVKDSKCQNCNVKYENLTDTHIALATFYSQPNKHVCNKCGQYLINHGGIDVNAIRDTKKEDN